MHILMTTDTVGGVWNYCVELIRALLPLDIHVTLASMGPPPGASQLAALAGLDNVELVLGSYKLEWMADSDDDLGRAGEWLLELERSKRPDLVHLNGYTHGALPWRAPALIVGHSCVLSWWRAVHQREAPASWDRYRERVRAGLAHARAVVAPTAWMLSQLLAAHDARFEGLVINNARRRSDFHPGPPTQIVLSAGRMWDAAKNLAALDAAASGLSWPVYIAGEIDHPIDHPDGHPIAAESSSEKREGAELLGPLAPSELAWWMARAAIYAHPARYEPFGLAPLEAALSGCALVLGDIGSLREIWGDAATFVAPDDHQALAAALQGLIDDPARRTRMAARAHARAQRYSVARMTAAYHDLYLELCGGDRVISACAS
jgi:glycogen synthase